MNILTILSSAMALIYLGIGAYLLAVKNLFFLTPFQQTGTGVILVSYGTFRFYRALKKMKEKELEGDAASEE